MTDLPLGSLTETTYAGPNDPIYLEFGGASRRITKRNLLGSTMVTPYDYGATPGSEDSVDNHSYVQAMFDACAGSYNSTINTYELTPRFAGMRFRCDDEVWVGGLRAPGMMIFGEGGGIYSNATGKIAFNLALCNRVFVHGFTVWGDATNAPDYGIYIGRAELNSSYPDARGIVFANCLSQGYFNRAGFISFASETHSQTNCLWQNRSRSLTAVAAAFVGHRDIIDNRLGGTIASDNSTFPTSGAGAQSNLGHELTGVTMERTADVTLPIVSIPRGSTTVVTVESGSLAGANFSNGDKVRFPNVTGMTELQTGEYTIASLNTGADTFELSGIDSTSYAGDATGGRCWSATGPALLLNGTHLFRADTLYTNSYSDKNIIIDMSAGSALRHFTMNFQPENKPDYAIELIAGSSGTQVCQNVNIVNMSSNQAYEEALFKYTGAGFITINGGTIEVTNLGASPTQKLIDDPSNLSLVNVAVTVPIQAVLNASSEYAAYNVLETAFDRSPKTKDFRDLAFASNPEFIASDISTPGLTVTAEDDGATVGPLLDIFRDSDDAAAADLIGALQLSGRDSAGVKTAYAKIRGKITDPTNGSEYGQIDFVIIKAGTETTIGSVRSDGLVSNGQIVQTNVQSDTASLNAIGNAINTTGKYTFKMVLNTDTNKPVFSLGSAANAVWVDATGTPAHSPS